MYIYVYLIIFTLKITAHILIGSVWCIYLMLNNLRKAIIFIYFGSIKINIYIKSCYMPILCILFKHIIYLLWLYIDYLKCDFYVHT